MTTSHVEPADLSNQDPNTNELQAAIVEQDQDKEPSRFKQFEPFLIGLISVALLFGFWQLYASVAHVSTLILPAPTRIISTFHTYISSGAIWPDLRASAQEFFIGYGIAVVGGIVVGITAGWYKRLRYTIAPFTWFFVSVPVLSLVTLITIWTGFGLEPKVIIVALSSFFPIMVNTMAGVRDIDTRLIRLENSYCANGWQVFRTLALPSSVPFILAGMRIGIGHAIAATYVAELGASANNGIGHMMINAGDALNTSQVFVGVIIFGVTGIAVTMLIGLLQKSLHHTR